MRQAALVGTGIAMPMAAPSPLVGEGITAGRSERGWVRGLPSDIAMQRQPLTRLHFAIADAKHRRRFKNGGRKAAYASPTGGEGKKSVRLTGQSA